MAKINLPRLEPLKGSTSQINTAFAQIEQAIENTVSRDGTDPNQMQAVLDMNSNRIINGSHAIAGSDYPTWEQVLGAISGGGEPIEVGEVNVGQNLGSGLNIYAGKQDVALQFNTIQAGNNVTMTQSGNTITISAAGGDADGDVSKITIFSVKDYGAVGDGVTDDSGAVQATLTAAQNTAALGGCIGVVYFPPGTYAVPTLGNLTGRIMMFAHPGGVEIVGNVSSEQTYPVSADQPVYLDCTAPYINIYGINFRTENTEPALYIRHIETGASDGKYVQVGQVTQCMFYGSFGFRADSCIQLGIETCTFFNEATGLDLRTCSNTNVVSCTLNNQSATSISIQPDPQRSSIRNNYPGGENVRISNCDIGSSVTGIYAYKNAWLHIINCMVDNCALPLGLNGSAEMTITQSYFGASAVTLDSLSTVPGFTTPPNMTQPDPNDRRIGAAAWIVGDQGDWTTGPVPSGGQCINCQFVSYNNYPEVNSNQTSPIVYVEGGSSGKPDEPNQGLRLRGEGTHFITCFFFINTSHSITPAMLHVDGINGVKIIANRFKSVNLTSPGHTTSPGFAPYKWETDPPETGVEDALAHSNDFYQMRDTDNTIIGTDQETTFGSEAPDLSNYYNKQESDARYRLKPFVTVVIGDSLTTFPEYDSCWPAHFGSHLVASGIDSELHVLSKDGWRYSNALNDAEFNGKTAIQRATELNPNLIIVSLGYNDGIGDGTTSTTDAASLFTGLRAALPNATIVYASQLPFDAARGNATSVNALSCIPYLMPRELDDGTKVDPIDNYLSSNYSDIGVIGTDKSLTTTARSRLQAWETLDAAIKSSIQSWVGTGGAATDYWFTLNIFKANRLGLGNDILHLKRIGQEFIAGYAFQHFFTNARMKTELPAIANLARLSALGTDPELLFASCFDAPSGGLDTDYTFKHTLNSNDFAYWAALRDHDLALGERTWFRPTHVTWTIDSGNYQMDLGLGRDTFFMYARNIVGLRYVHAKVWTGGVGNEPAFYQNIAVTADGTGVTPYAVADTMVYSVTGSQFKDTFNLSPGPTLSTHWMKIKICGPNVQDVGEVFGPFLMDIQETPFDSGSVGKENFIELLDTPNDYTGQANKAVAVNGAANALEFIDFPSGGVNTFTALSDTPGSYSGAGTYIVRVNPSASSLEFQPITSIISASRTYLLAGENSTEYDYSGSSGTSSTVSSWQGAFNFTLNPSQSILSGDSFQFTFGLMYALLAPSYNSFSGLTQVLEGCGIDIRIRIDNTTVAQWDDAATLLPTIAGGGLVGNNFPQSDAILGRVVNSGGSPTGDTVEFQNEWGYDTGAWRGQIREAWLSRYTAWAHSGSLALTFNYQSPSNGSKFIDVQYRLTAVRLQGGGYAYPNIRQKTAKINPNSTKTTWTAVQVRDAF